MALSWACQIVPKPSWRSSQVQDVKGRFDEFDVLPSFDTNSWRSLLLRSRAAEVTKVTTVMNQRVRKKWRAKSAICKMWSEISSVSTASSSSVSDCFT